MPLEANQLRFHCHNSVNGMCHARAVQQYHFKSPRRIETTLICSLSEITEHLIESVLMNIDKLTMVCCADVDLHAAQQKQQ